jgi:hypothetical protein
MGLAAASKFLVVFLSGPPRKARSVNIRGNVSQIEILIFRRSP